jgi:hypothetical protein
MGARIVSVKKPGQRGTKKYVAQYGDKLRVVRYIYDEATSVVLPSNQATLSRC